MPCFLFVCALLAVRVVNADFLSTTIQLVVDQLQATFTPISQMQMVFEHELFDLNARSTSVHVATLQYIQLIGCSVLLEEVTLVDEKGFVSSLAYQGSRLLTTSSMSASCMNTTVEPPCFNEFYLDNHGSPTQFSRSEHRNFLVEGWYNKTKSAQSCLSFLQPTSTDLFLTQTGPITVNSTFAGVASTSFSVAQFDKLLKKYVVQEPTAIVLFVIERTTSLLVAASAPNLTFVSDSAGELVSRVKAQNALHSVVSDVAKFLEDTVRAQTLKTSGHFVHNNYFIRTELLADDRGKDWVFVLVYPATVRVLQVTPNSAQFYALLVCTIILGAATVILFGWVACFRFMRLWEAAQPSMLLLILASNLTGCIGQFTLIVSTTDSSCLARQWCLFLAVLFGVAALVAALARSYTVHTIVSTPKLRVGNRLAVGFVACVVLVWVVIEVVWTVVDPLQVTMISQDSSDGKTSELVATCASSNKGPFLAILVLLFAIIAMGLRVVYVCRELESPFLDNQALGLLFLQATITVVAVSISWAVISKRESFIVLSGFAGLWCVFSSHLMLFAPRVYRHVTKGDLTADEIRNGIKERIAAVAQRQARLEQKHRAHITPRERASVVSPMGLTVVV